MSQRNREGKATARERMRIERERRARRAKRLRTLTVLGSVLAVLAVAVVVIAVVSSNTGKPVAAPAGSSDSNGKGALVLPVGSAAAPVTLTMYEDFRCPACGLFEKTNHATVDKLVAEKKVRVKYHIVSFIDDNSGGTGSKKSANAAACAYNGAGSATFFTYHDLLYANQPEETTDGYGSNAKLIALAKKVPGLDSAAFESCVKAGTYAPWAKNVLSDFNKSGYQSTPTVLINGKKVDQPSAVTPDQLTKLVADAAKK